MELGRVAVGFTLVVVLGSTVLSGPLVDAVDLTPTSSITAPPEGSGTANVRVDSVPVDDVTLERGRFGARSYHVDSPPVRATVLSVDGNPVLRYVVFIRALDFATTREVPLAGMEGQTIRVRPGTAEISPERIENGSYTARVTVWVRGENNEFESLYQKTVSVEVEEQG